MKKDKIDILELLEAGRTVQIKPQGYSMYPMFIPDRDSAIIVKANHDKLNRGDVVLYKREGGILVLHRIWMIKGDGVYLIGDNQETIEGPLSKKQIKGILIAFIYDGKTISVSHPIYWLLSRAWLILRPFRRIIKIIAARLIKIFLYNQKNKRK